MKQLFLFIFLLAGVAAQSQDKDEITILNNTRLMHQAVFAKKDTQALGELFADKISYGHSGGKMEHKAEAIKNVGLNPSIYENLEMGPVSLWLEDKTAVTRHMMSAEERTKEGKVNPLRLHIMLVWIKEKKGWKVLARQAVKI